jgi:PAS domain S-box-containing protein
MNLKKLFAVLFGIQMVFVFCLGVLTLILFRNQSNLNKSQNVHFLSNQLADELRQSSDDLTRMARAYVATRNPEFEREYWTVLDIRNGKLPRPINYNRIYWDFVSVTGLKPRPDGETISLQDLMIREGFTKSEFEKLAEAQKNSDGLVKTETIAMHAVKGLFDDGTGNFTIRRKPDQEMANRIMNDESYYKNKVAIMKPIDEFFVMIENRTVGEVVRYERNSKYLLISIMSLIAIIIGTFLVSYITIKRQITRRMRAEEKLKIYEHTIKSINDIVNIANLNDNIILVNPAFCKAYGYSEEELIGKHSSLFWSERNPKEMVAEILPATLKGGWKGELYNKRKNGTEFPIHLSTAIIKNDSGTPIAVVGIARDITKEKESEIMKNSLYKISEAVNQTTDMDSFYRQIHEIVKELMPADNFYIALIDPDSDLLSFPYFIDEMDPPISSKKLGRGCTEYVLRTGKAIIIDKALDEELRLAGEVEIIGAPSEVWLGVPLKISGSTIGVMVVQDYKNENAYTIKEKQILIFVSEHVASAIYKKRTEEKVRQLASIVDSSEDAIIGKNLAGIVTSWNNAAEKIYGYTESEMIGKSISLLIPPGKEDDLPKIMDKIRSGENILAYETVRRRKDGRDIQMSLTVSSIKDTNGRIVAASTIGHDITERKQAEIIIQQKNDQLQELNATKDKFFSIIAHDLKSPFHGFLGLTKEIIQSASNISVKELTQLGSTMYQAADNLFKLLQNLLEWAQMQSGSASIVLKDILLTNMITEYVEAIKVRSEQKGISIINMVTEPIYAYADEKMINSVLMNLLSNAVKFTPRNGTVKIKAKKTENQMIEISIRDTGIGMPDNVVEKLFKVGEKTGRKGTEGELSTGLGLLLCKEFIDRNGGKIWVDSQEGKGSTFSFTLPETRIIPG